VYEFSRTANSTKTQRRWAAQTDQGGPRHGQRCPKQGYTDDREAVELAAREVTDSQGRKGLAAWLLERANGSVADRQIFAGMVAKALPLTINGTGSGITINLNWLQGREIINVTNTAQGERKPLIHNEDKRISNQAEVIEGETVHQADEKTPPTPHQSAGGEGS
jgi:hypothetical protein